MNVHHPSSALADVMGKLADLGYAAPPVQPGTKRPGEFRFGRWSPMPNWTERGVPTAFEIEAWSRYPRAGVCVLLGPASGGLVAVDIDTDDPAILSAVLTALPGSPAMKRGKKGQTLFFRGNGLESRAFDLVDADGRRHRVVDLLSRGRQTVLPPSIHPDSGNSYVWIGEDALEDIPPHELPQLPENTADLIAEALKPHGYRAEPERSLAPRATTGADEKTPHRQLNEHALANLDAWVPRLELCRARKTPKGWEAVPLWRASNSGRPIVARKLNLKVTSEGITDFGDGPHGYTAIDLVIAAGRAPDAEQAFAWLADATNWGSEVFHDPQPRVKVRPQPEPEVAERAPTPAMGIPIADPITMPTSSRAAAPVAGIPSTPPWRAPVDVTDCPGLVGEIARWITDSAISPQPLLALGAALTLVGTVAGRQLAGPTKSGTHLYVIAVAPTGAGKDHPLRAINDALVAAKLSSLVGPGKFTSESAVVNTVIRSPACVCTIDEFGGFLGRNKGRNASSHEKGISDVLRTVFNASFKAVPTTERAGEKFKLLYSPALSIYGTSTTEELYAALGDAETRNGFLNRFLILENDQRPLERDPLLEEDVPRSVVDGLKAIYWRLGDLGAANYHGVGDQQPGKPEVVPWRDESAKLAYDEFRAEIRGRMDREPETECFFARSAEIAVRIATIRAVGIDWKDPRVTRDDMLWGIAVARLSAQAMIEGARDNIAENDRQRHSNRVLEIIKRRGTASIRDLQQSLKGLLKSHDLQDILAALVEAGRVEKVDVTDRRSDTKQKHAYRYVQA